MPEERYLELKNRIRKKIREKYVCLALTPRPFKEVMEEIGVNISGYLRSGLGLGESARNLIYAIATQDIPFVLNDFRLHGLRKVKTRFDRNYRRDNPYRFNLVNVSPDRWIFYTVQDSRGYFEGRYNIGVWYWETQTIPQEWVYCFQFFHEIWVATDFIRDAVSPRAPIPVIKVPTVIRIDPEPVAQRYYFNIPEDRYLFLFVFDFNCSMFRKNPLAVVRAFKDAFSCDECAMLCLKSSNGKQSGSGLHRLYDEVDGAGNIKVIDEYLDRKKLNTLMNVSDCYVSLHRAEGFGMTIAEMMLLGKPAIVTAYSGNMDFTNERNSLLVDYTLIELDRDVGLYRKGTVWAEPDTVHASSLMRWAFECRDEAAALGKRGAETVRGRYSEQTVGETIRLRLASIVDAPMEC